MDLFLCDAMRYDMIRCDAIRYDTIRYDAIQYDTIRYDTMQYNKIQYNTTQHNSLVVSLAVSLAIPWLPPCSLSPWLSPCRLSLFPDYPMSPPPSGSPGPQSTLTELGGRIDHPGTVARAQVASQVSGGWRIWLDLNSLGSDCVNVCRAAVAPGPMYVNSFELADDGETLHGKALFQEYGQQS